MIKFLALITWTLFIWVWSAVIWYNCGLSNGKEQRAKSKPQKDHTQINTYKEQDCLGIDCAWCMNVDCPKEKKGNANE